MWAGIFVVIQVFLDLYFAGYIKAGHYVGFLAGLLLGILVRAKKTVPERNCF